jgi:photosystem II stability/assembly factor-like uncharacterized protein
LERFMTTHDSFSDGNDGDLVYQFTATSSGWYAARASGLYRSIDQGASWQPAYTSLGIEGDLTTLTVAASGSGQSQLVFAGLSGELLRSTDGGDTWELASKPTPAPVFVALAPSPDFARDGQLFAGTMQDGVLLYRDYGRDWVLWNMGLLDGNILCLTVSPAYAEDQTLFAGAQSGLFRSSNGGRSWREVDLPVGYTTVLSLALSPSFAQDGTLYAGTEDHGLLRSTDRGRSWQPLGEGTWTEPINSVLVGSEFDQRPELLVLHGGSLLHSADGGGAWALWREEQLAGQDVTAALAPHGFGAGAPAVVGLGDGEIRRIE